MSLLNHPKKALKLKPSIPVKRSEPWKEIENIAKKTSGGILYFIRDHIYLIIGGLILYLGTIK